MMRIFATAEWKKAAQKLAVANMKEGGCKQVTQYYQIEYLVNNQMGETNCMNAYLKSMKRSELTPELVLKYLVVIHTYIRQATDLQQNKLIEFMNHLLPKCEQMVIKFAKVTQKRESSFLSKSMGPKSSTSTSDETFGSKEVLLLNGIVKPYISLLLKMLSVSSEYRDLQSRTDSLQDHQAWMLINLLKMMAGIVNHFCMIGRYFIKQYGHLVVLLTRVLAPDVQRFVSLLKSHTAAQNSALLSLYENGKDTTDLLRSYISMMEEVSKLNEALMEMYLGKYFYKYVLDLPEPKWFNTTSKQFAEIYGLWRSTPESNGEKPIQYPGFESKKRSRSLNSGTKKKGNCRARADFNNDNPFSYLF